MKDEGILNIARAQMRILITLPSKIAKKTKLNLKNLLSSIEDEKWDRNNLQLTVTFLFCLVFFSLFVQPCRVFKNDVSLYIMIGCFCM